MPTPISERHHIFVGTHRAWAHFRRQHEDAKYFRYVNNYRSLRGREVGYVVVSTAEPITTEQDEILRECQMWHPDCVILTESEVAFPITSGALRGTAHCMWCGKGFTKDEVEAHEEVCSG